MSALDARAEPDGTAAHNSFCEPIILGTVNGRKQGSFRPLCALLARNHNFMMRSRSAVAGVEGATRIMLQSSQQTRVRDHPREQESTSRSLRNPNGHLINTGY